MLLIVFTTIGIVFSATNVEAFLTGEQKCSIRKRVLISLCQKPVCTLRAKKENQSHWRGAFL